MATLTREQVTRMWRHAYSAGSTSKAAIKTYAAAVGMPTRAQLKAAFEALDDAYDAMPPPRKTETEQVARPTPSADRVRLERVRAAYRDLHPEHAQVFVQAGVADPWLAARNGLDPVIASLQASVDAETPPTFADWWTRWGANVTALVSTAWAQTVPGSVARHIVRAWMEVRF